jgi:hypothetical protein
VPDAVVGQPIQCGGCGFDIDVPAEEELPVADDKVPDDQRKKTNFLGNASLSCGLAAAGCYTFVLLLFIIRPSFLSLGMAIGCILIPIAMGIVLALAGAIMGMVSLVGQESADTPTKEDPDGPTTLGCFLSFLCLAVVLFSCFLGLVGKARGKPPTRQGPSPTVTRWPGQ